MPECDERSEGAGDGRCYESGASYLLGMTEISAHGDQVPPERPSRGRAMDVAEALQLARLRAMTATEKVAVMHALHRQAWALTRAGVRARHPECSEADVEARVRAHFLQPQP